MKNALVLLSLAASTGLCQTADKPDTLQTLLSEVHQLRQAIETMTVASQRVQIAVYTLQLQDAAVARDTARFDSVHERCLGVEAQRQKWASDIQTVESDTTANTAPAQATQQAVLAQYRRELELKAAEAQACQSTEADVLSPLRNEQATLGDLQERIQHLDKVLEKAGGADK
jgi:hypothetical protein